MAGGVQRDAHAMVLHGLAIRQSLQRDVRAQAGTQHAGTVVMGQVVGMAGTRMVRMAVRDHGPFHGPPGVDVEVAGRAVQAFWAGHDQVGSHAGSRGGMHMAPC
jgi:hypothetical protein